MTIEYQLQKKTIGGWSHVTWYADEVEALKNFNTASQGNSGYSWRVMKCEVVQEKLLVDHEEVKPMVNTRWIDKKEATNLWPTPPVWPTPKPGEFLTKEVIVNKAVEMMAGKLEHGMTGKAWLINHSTKERKRVDPSEVDAMIAQGWERGGPKTAFREVKLTW